MKNINKILTSIYLLLNELLNLQRYKISFEKGLSFFLAVSIIIWILLIPWHEEYINKQLLPMIILFYLTYLLSILFRKVNFISLNKLIKAFHITSSFILFINIKWSFWITPFIIYNVIISIKALYLSELVLGNNQICFQNDKDHNILKNYMKPIIRFLAYLLFIILLNQFILVLSLILLITFRLSNAIYKKNGNKYLVALNITQTIILIVIASIIPNDSFHTYDKIIHNQSRLLPVRKKIKTNEGYIEYLEYGEQYTKTILLFHGFPDNANSWNSVANLLMNNKIRVIVPYLRGLTESEFSSVNKQHSGQLAALVTDAKDLVEFLKLKTFYIGGHDWGGRIAQSISVLYPKKVEGLISFSGYSISYSDNNHFSLNTFRSLWYQLFLNLPIGSFTLDFNQEQFLYTLWSEWSPSWPEKERLSDFNSVSFSFQNEYYNDIVLSAYSFSRHGYDLQFNLLEEYLENSPKINIPTIIIQGEDDPLETPGLTKEYDEEMFVGGLDRLILKKCGHWPHREKPKEVSRIIINFINLQETKKLLK